MPVRSNFQLAGLEEYLEKLAKAGLDVDDAAADAVSAGAEIVYVDVEENVPVGETGQLADSLYKSEPQRDGNFTFVEFGVDEVPGRLSYETYVEYGTALMPAQPFFRPAIDRNRAKVKKVERDVLRTKGIL